MISLAGNSKAIEKLTLWLKFLANCFLQSQDDSLGVPRSRYGVPRSGGDPQSRDVPQTGVVPDLIIKWKHFPRYWTFVRESTGHPWIPLTKASVAELWCFLWYAPWINGANHREAGDLRRHRIHYDVTVMIDQNLWISPKCHYPLPIPFHSITHIDGLVQDCSISGTNALEILQSCTKPSICCLEKYVTCFRWDLLSFVCEEPSAR